MGISKPFDAFLTAAARHTVFAFVLLEESDDGVQPQEQEQQRQQQKEQPQQRGQWPQGHQKEQQKEQDQQRDACSVDNVFPLREQQSQRKQDKCREGSESPASVSSYSSHQVQQSIEQRTGLIATWQHTNLMRPKQARQTGTSEPPAAPCRLQQQRQESAAVSGHLAAEMFRESQQQNRKQRGETLCSFCGLPEAHRGFFSSSLFVRHSQFSRSERPEADTPSERLCHASSPDKPTGVPGRVAGSRRLLTSLFSLGCCLLTLGAGTLPSRLSTGLTASFPVLFAAADYPAVAPYRQPPAGDGPARDGVAHCGRNSAADVPAPSSIARSSASRSPLLAAAGGAVTSRAPADFHPQNSSSSNRTSDGLPVVEDVTALSRAVAAARAAAAAIKRLYTAVYPYLPSVLQLWKLRYPQNTFPPCLNFPTIKELSEDARAVRPALQRLKHKTFFRIFKLRLPAESCADTRLSELLNKRADICTEPQRCGLCECSEDEVPPVWRQVPDEEFVDRRHAASFTRWTQHKSCRQPDDPFSIFKAPDRLKDDVHGAVAAPPVSSAALGSSNNSSSTESRGVYVDLLLNPPMYTRYEGGDVWRFLYSQVPLPHADSAAAPPSSSAGASPAVAARRGRAAASSSGVASAGERAAAGAGDEWPLVENEQLTNAQLCSNNANLRRVLSGMQANIAALACENFLVIYPPNGHFDPRAAFPLLPTSTAHLPPSEGSAPAAASGGTTSATSDFSSESASQSTTSSSFSTPWTGERESAAQTPSSVAASPMPPTFGRNLSFFRERLADHPLRVQNLYFVFGLLLRTVCSLSDVLQECSCETGHRGEDLSARADLLHVLNVTTISTHACNPRYMDRPLFDPDHLAFLSSMESTDSLLRCIRCEKCRLHGKIKLGALHIAGKMLSSSESLPFLERNQVTALINALYYFADAIRVVEEMQEQINKHNITIYVLFACLALLILLTAALFLPCTRSARKTLLWRTCEVSPLTGDIDVKKLQ